MHNTDYLGSILAITNNAGALEETHSFDAWGRKRNPSDWSSIQAIDDDFTSTITDRGFTGHEHLDAFGLINMNGRLYDPVLGRMLSPDNFIQSPGSPMGMNRYMYANNNPLKFTDPSGNMPAVVVWLIYNVVRNAIQYLVNRRNGMSNDEALQNQVWTLSYNGNMPNSWYGKNSTIPSDPINGSSGMYNNSVIANSNNEEVDPNPWSLYDMSLMASNEAGGMDSYSFDYEFNYNSNTDYAGLLSDYVASASLQERENNIYNKNNYGTAFFESRSGINVNFNLANSYPANTYEYWYSINVSIGNNKYLPTKQSFVYTPSYAFKNNFVTSIQPMGYRSIVRPGGSSVQGYLIYFNRSNGYTVGTLIIDKEEYYKIYRNYLYGK